MQTMPIFLVKGNDKELAVLDDDRVNEQIRKLNIFLSGMERDILEMGASTGDSPLNGSIGFLANSKDSHLPDNASKETVIAAVKHFSGIIKKCSEISAQLIRFGQ